uniref:ORF3 n=1 Tax=Torque teno Leptonychotes weddellii virus-1 TaxID=2012676 RepID=A0A1Z2RVD2_9VIRU|nr:ORF3 [Torque teno Leptonychotes weddellii virus 1]
MTSYRETSTQTEFSRTELMKELLDLIHLHSQPSWKAFSPVRAPKSESNSETLLESVSESEQGSSSDFYWEDEENPGGEGPPLIPPQ